MIKQVSVTKSSLDTLGAIARFRHQHRFSRGWLLGDRRVTSAAVARLEQKSLVREVAISGQPTLVLTEIGKRLLDDHPQE